MSDDIKQRLREELFAWLLAKYQRHGEIKDGEAAALLIRDRDEIEALEARVDSATDLLVLAAGIRLAPSGVAALPLAVRERIEEWLKREGGE